MRKTGARRIWSNHHGSVETVLPAILTHPAGLMLLSALLFGCGIGPNSAPPDARQSADLVLRGGRIWTGLPAQDPPATAVAIARGKILEIGSDDQINRLVSPGTTEVVELEGGTVTPGIHDLQVELLRGGRMLSWLDLSGARTRSEVLRQVGQAASRTPTDQWILGRGWRESSWPGRELPTRHQLDRVAPNHIVMLARGSGQCFWLNSRALQRLRISKNSRISGADWIPVDNGGAPTGIMLGPATNVVWAALPRLTRREQRDALLRGLRACAANGITTISDPSTPIDLLEDLATRGSLSLRVRSWLTGPQTLTQVTFYRQLLGPDHPQLRLGGMRLRFDGSLDLRTAALGQRYRGRQDSGRPYHPAARLTRLIRSLREARSGLAVHADGDRAIETVLGIAARTPGVLTRLEGGRLLTREQAQLLSKAGILLVRYPAADPTPAHTRALLPDALAHRLQVAQRTNEGRVGYASSWPAGPLNPLTNLARAMRTSRISAAQALQRMTHQAAQAAGWTRTGAIEVGRRADLTVFDRDLVRLDAARLEQAAVVMTIFNGQPTRVPAPTTTPISAPKKAAPRPIKPTAPPGPEPRPRPEAERKPRAQPAPRRGQRPGPATSPAPEPESSRSPAPRTRRSPKPPTRLSPQPETRPSPAPATRAAAQPRTRLAPAPETGAATEPRSSPAPVQAGTRPPRASGSDTVESPQPPLREAPRASPGPEKSGPRPSARPTPEPTAGTAQPRRFDPPLARRLLLPSVQLWATQIETLSEGNSLRAPPPVREIVALGAEAIDASIDLLDDARRHVRLAGHWILTQLAGFDLGRSAEVWRAWWKANRGRTRIAWLLALAKNGDAPLKPRTQALSNLGQPGATKQLLDLAEIYRDALERPYRALRDRVLAAIGRIGGPQAAASLIRYGLKDPAPGNRARTVIILGRLPGADTTAALRAMLADQGKTVWGTTVAEEAEQALARRRKRN